MDISVSRPINLAVERAKRICFQPFDAGKWFTLGFCAFLARLGEGGGSGGFNWGGGAPPIPGGGGGGGGGGLPTGTGGAGPELDIGAWIQSNLGMILAIGLGVLVAGAALTLLLTWLHARGKFMFLDGVVHNRGLVVAPWKEFRAHGNSLLWFYIMLMCVALMFILLVGVLCVAIAWTDIQAREFGGGATAAIVIALLMLLPFGIVMALIQFFTKEFVIPTMYLRDQTARAAWSTVRREVFSIGTGTIILYVLMKIGLGMVIGLIALVATLLTCCIALIPYLGSVILLPLFVFDRCFSLHFLEQLGPAWRVFPEDPQGPYCRKCGYNLFGNVSGVCPECGTPIVHSEQPPIVSPAVPPTVPPTAPPTQPY